MSIKMALPYIVNKPEKAKLNKKEALNEVASVRPSRLEVCQSDELERNISIGTKEAIATSR